jgi:glucose/arabinose dehydrogenase
MLDFDWQPLTGQLWFTDNGRDMMGEEMPSNELNRLTRPNEHFGFP